MDYSILCSMAVIWVLAAVTPGPNFFITIHTAVGTTRRMAFCTVAGIVSGTLIWAVSGFSGISFLFNTVPVLYIFLKTAGGVYLVYVGMNLIFKKKSPQKRDKKQHTSAARCYRLGLFTNLLNPKTAVFMTSLFAATLPAEAPPQFGVACVLMICAVSAIWYTLVAMVFSFETAKKGFAHYKRIIEKIAGAVFVGFGVKLAVSE
ncbi:MAG: LysE family translocator [Desulfobacterales bacterium]|nr:LysE family translocator [Desulfobacterales bacterium]